MKTEVNQLKLTVTNIKSVLLSSSKKMVKIKKDNDRLREDAIKLKAIEMSENSLESTSSTSDTAQLTKKRKINAKDSLLNKAATVVFGFLGGIFVNAIQGLVRTLKNFYKENEPIFNKLGEFGATFGRGIVKVWDTNEDLRKKIGEGFNKVDWDSLKQKMNGLNELGDSLKKIYAPILNNDGNIDPMTNIKDDETGETIRFGETFDDPTASDELKSQIEEWKSEYYVDQHGTVRHKDTNGKAFGARWMGVGTGMDFKDIKKLLDKKNYSKNMKLTPLNKDNDLQALNNGDNSGTTVIIAKQFIEV